MKLLLFCFLIAVLNVNSIQSQLLKTVPAAIGSSVNLDCDVGSTNRSAIKFELRTIGVAGQLIATGIALNSGVTGYTLTNVSASIIRLTINSVSSTDYRSVYSCVDPSRGLGFAVFEITSVATSVCDNRGLKGIPTIVYYQPNTPYNITINIPATVTATNLGCQRLSQSSFDILYDSQTVQSAFTATYSVQYVSPNLIITVKNETGNAYLCYEASGPTIDHIIACPKLSGEGKNIVQVSNYLISLAILIKLLTF